MDKMVGILRSAEFSPNSNDLTIMQKVAEKLQTHSISVSLKTEKEFVTENVDADAFFSMGRGKRTLEKLETMEWQGKIVVNPVEGVRNCARPVITELMKKYGVPVPKSYVWNVGAEETHSSDVAYPCWIKRGDSSAKQKEDICFIRNEREMQQAIESFRSRAIPTIVYNEHLAGDIIKFYGVATTGFFYWYYPTLGDEIHSKFGLETINGVAQQFPFDSVILKKEAERVAEFSCTPVYGGDCIVDTTGCCRIIDFNDWPSFSRCVDGAADAITKYILHK